MIVAMIAALCALPQVYAVDRDTPHRLQGEIKDIDRDRSTVTVKGEETVVTVRCNPNTNFVAKEKGAGAELRDFHKGAKVMVTYVKDPEGGLMCLELVEKGTKAYKEDKEEGR